jgi:hypothetical protein
MPSPFKSKQPYCLLYYIKQIFDVISCFFGPKNTGNLYIVFHFDNKAQSI